MEASEAVSSLKLLLSFGNLCRSQHLTEWVRKRGKQELVKFPEPSSFSEAYHLLIKIPKSSSDNQVSTAPEP